MIGIIIQARMGSTRLPGKVMMPIQDKPLLYYILNQVKHCKSVSKIIVATTNLEEDNVIVNYVKSQNLDIFRGSVENVLDRYFQCAKEFDLDIIIRVTSDCPLIDPAGIDECVSKFLKLNLDYISNANKKQGNSWIYNLSGFPAGYGVEVFKFSTLTKTWNNATKPSEKEHVTQYILNNPANFQIGNIENQKNFSDIRLTVDHKIDFDLVKIIIENFPNEHVFTLNEMLEFFKKNPKLKQINSHILFNEGYLKSLKEDTKKNSD